MRPDFHGQVVLYYVDSGLKAIEGTFAHGKAMKVTWWRFDGLTVFQGRAKADSPVTENIYGPPWLWGVTDQTEPTAPWIEKR